MREFAICGLDELREQLHVFKPDAVLTMLGASEEALRSVAHMVKRAKVGTHMSLVFDDLHFPVEGYIAPAAQDIADIRRFAGKTRGKRTLVHCAAGISRSTAGMLIVLADDEIERGESQLMGLPFAVKKARPWAYPNRLMISLYCDTLTPEQAKTLWEGCEVAFSDGVVGYMQREQLWGAGFRESRPN